MSSGFDLVNETGAMCCICFDWVGMDSLWVCPHLVKWDTCVPCGEMNGCEHLIHDNKGD